ncbi:hypothetical protein [Streptomyces paludis]|uniref:Uncharacterized protein n=1 Tax=Streptomyces paludis TaxID=2282738 RepID=A0A345HVB3_9ACTN|nr:hypothetical protein [Streptomyces paludis]AXG80637.1 hypothetical protein DVK44_26510 [Streptomyces paludis]
MERRWTLLPAVALGGVWWWAVLRLALEPERTGLVEGAVAAGGWGLSLLPVHVAASRRRRAGRIAERAPEHAPGAAGAGTVAGPLPGRAVGRETGREAPPASRQQRGPDWQEGHQ